jgi:hypothetical protein
MSIIILIFVIGILWYWRAKRHTVMQKSSLVSVQMFPRPVVVNEESTGDEANSNVQEADNTVQADSSVQEADNTVEATRRTLFSRRFELPSTAAASSS